MPSAKTLTLIVNANCLLLSLATMTAGGFGIKAEKLPLQGSLLQQKTIISVCSVQLSVTFHLFSGHCDIVVRTAKMTGFSGANQKGYGALIRVSDEPIKVNLRYSDNCAHILCFHFVFFSSAVSFMKEQCSHHVILITMGKIYKESVC